MNAEQMVAIEERVRVHAAMADPTRLRIVDLLTVTDASVSRVGADLGVPSNLLAHHLNVLESAGLVTRRRSEGDARRTYLSLDGSRAGLVVSRGILVRARRVLFVCTANTARSHLAAALWRRVSAVEAGSAGTEPGIRINTRALTAARRHDLVVPDVEPRALDASLRDDDLVITVCDRAHEQMGGRGWAHWSVPDPVPAGTPRAFDRAYADLERRIRVLAPHVAAS